MTPVNWLRAHSARPPAQTVHDTRPAPAQDVPNLWAFLIHVTGEPPTWSGIAKLVALAMTVVLSVALLIGAAGWALHEAPLPGRADQLTTAGAVAVVAGALLAALKTRLLRRQLARGLTGPGSRTASEAPRVRLVDRDVA
jgi:hypothetical protein